MKLCQSIMMPSWGECLPLFEAVARNPEEMTPRLALADEIESQGDEFSLAVAAHIRESTKPIGDMDGEKRLGVTMGLDRVDTMRVLGAPIMVSRAQQKRKGPRCSENYLFRYQSNWLPWRLSIRADQLTRQNLAAWTRYVPLTEVKFISLEPRRVQEPDKPPVWVVNSLCAPRPSHSDGEWQEVFGEIITEAMRLRGYSPPVIKEWPYETRKQTTPLARQRRAKMAELSLALSVSFEWKTRNQCLEDISRAAVNIFRRAAGYPDYWEPEPAEAA